jgi:co-chaperonin GroES (HSP10)
MSNATEGENIPIEERAKQMPDPTGWKILCAVPEIDDRFEGTEIVRPDSNKTQEQFATVVLFVIKLGPDAYKDTSKYPSGPWCKEGDFIIARQYSGTRLLIHGKEFRVIYDDQVEAVVQDPRGISRV